MKPFGNKSILAIIIYISCLLLNTSCNIKECCDNMNTIVGSGELVSDTLDLTSFNQISITGQAIINVIHGDTQKVVLRAQQNILDVLTHEVNKGIFKLGTKNNSSFQTSKGIFLDIVSPEAITKTEVTGAADMTITGNKQDSFEISITGTGSLNATALEVDNCNITISGTGNCKVWVNKKLTVNISGTGTITYIGNPQIDQTISGTGRVISGN
jgi:hypothetical protein